MYSNKTNNKTQTKNKNQKELIYGINTIEALINTYPQKLLTIFYEKKLINAATIVKTNNHRINNILNLASKFGISIQEVNSKAIDRWFHDQLDGNKSHKINHQGIAAYVAPINFLAIEDLISMVKDNQRNKNPIFLVLDNIQDPMNLGACIRSAAAFNVNAIIISRNNTCDITSAVKKSACGAAELVPIAKVGNLNNCLLMLKEQGVWVISLAATHSQDLSNIDLKIPVALVLGSENSGVRNIIKQNSDFLAKIPMNNNLLDSLNLSVAAGICLYEVNKQRNYE